MNRDGTCAQWPCLKAGLIFATMLAMFGEAAHCFAVENKVTKYSPGMQLQSFAGRPDSELIEFSDGRQVRLGDMRRIEQSAQRLRSAPKVAVVPPGLQFKPAASGTRVDTSKALADALKRPDSDTLVLPSGAKLTVGQLKFLQPMVEKRLGHPLGAASGRPQLSGPVTKVTAQTDLKSMLSQPDSTVLESPNGKRVTVGELKQVIKSRQTDGRVRPTVTR